MSNQKKSLYLQELQQAIKKKVQQKSKNKDQMNRLLQSSIEKKKSILKTVTNKDNRLSTINKNSQLSNKAEKTMDKQISIFNNEQLNTIESSQFKFKKYNNRKIDKLISLIQYMISSSEKALKYISSTNFQAEFALKLYKSDKENLVNELKNINFQEIFDSHQKNQRPTYNKVDHNFNVLLQENNKLKKQILILQKQAQNFHKGLSKIQDERNDKTLQKQNIKLKQMLRKLISFDTFKQITQLLDKQSKLESMFDKYTSSHKKAAEIQILINKFQEERVNIVENLSRGKVGQSKTDRSYKVYEIQQQKQELQKELNHMKSKLSEIIQSSKSLGELELLKKNSQLVSEKLNSLYLDLSQNPQQKSKRRTNDELINYIKSRSLELLNAYNQSIYVNNQYNNEINDLKSQLLQLKQYRSNKQNEFNQRQDQFQEMLERYQKFKNKQQNLLNENEEMNNYIKQLQNQRQGLQNNVRALQLKLQISEKQKTRLNLKISQINNSNQKKMQQTTKKLKQSADKIRQLQQIIERYEQKQGQSQALKIQLEQNLKSLEQQLSLRNYQIIKLTQQNQASSQAFNSQKYEKDIQQLKKSLKDKEIELNNVNKHLRNNLKDQQLLQGQIQDKQACLIKLNVTNKQYSQEITALKIEINRLISQLQVNSELLKSIQTQIIDSSSTKDQLNKYKTQYEHLMQLLNANQAQMCQKDKNITMLMSKIQQFSSRFQRGLQSQKKQHEQQLFIIKSEKQYLMQQLQTRQSQLVKIKQQLSLIKLQQSRQQDLIKQYENKCIELLNNQNNLTKEIEINKQKYSAEQSLANKQVDILKSQNQRNLLKITQIKEEIQLLISQIKQLKLVLTQKNNQLDSLKQQTKRYQSEIAEMTEQIINLKQRMDDQHQINHFKTTQYANLLKQILKGLLLDYSKFQHFTSFQELLQFGAKQVVQLRKKQRQQDSIKRRNTRRQNEDKPEPQLQQISQFSELDGMKTRLFSDGELKQHKLLQQSPNQSQKQKLVLPQVHQAKEQTTILNNNNNKQQSIDIDEFVQLKNQINDSMISQDNLRENINNQDQKENNLQQFDEIKSMNLNDSVVSQPFQNDHDKSYQDIVKQNEIIAHEDIDNQQINIRYSMVQDKLVEQKYDDVELLNNNNSMFCGNVLSYKPQVDKFRVDVDDLDEIKSCEQNESLASNRSYRIEQPQNKQNLQDSKPVEEQNINNNIPIHEKFDDFNNISQVIFKQKESQNLAQSKYLFESSVQQKTIQNKPVVDNFILTDIPQSKKGEELNNEQFRDVKVDQINNSVCSSNKEQINFSQFKDIPNDVNSSMISQSNEQNNKIQPEQEQGLSQFGSILHNQSNMPAQSHSVKETGEQHELAQFDQMKNDQLNDSIISQHVQEKQNNSALGFSQFNEIYDDKMGQSIISHKIQEQEEDIQQHGLQQFINMEHNGNNEPLLQNSNNNAIQNLGVSSHGLSEFGELEDNKQNDSILSQKNEIQKVEVDLDQFNEMQENPINTSVISEDQQQNFSQFNEMQAQDNKMNDSIVSEKDNYIEQDLLDEKSKQQQQNKES